MLDAMTSGLDGCLVTLHSRPGAGVMAKLTAYACLEGADPQIRPPADRHGRPPTAVDGPKPPGRAGHRRHHPDHRLRRALRHGVHAAAVDAAGPAGGGRSPSTNPSASSRTYTAQPKPTASASAGPEGSARDRRSDGGRPMGASAVTVLAGGLAMVSQCSSGPCARVPPRRFGTRTEPPGSPDWHDAGQVGRCRGRPPRRFAAGTVPSTGLASASPPPSIAALATWALAIRARSALNVTEATQIAQFTSGLANQAAVAPTVVEAIKDAAPLVPGRVGQAALTMAEEVRIGSLPEAADRFAATVRPPQWPQCAPTC